MAGALKFMSSEPLLLALSLVTDSRDTKARSASWSRARPVVMPVGTTPVIVAVWPISVRSTSVKMTGMVAVSASLLVFSVRAVASIALMSGVSLVPVMVMLTSWLASPPFPSSTITK